MKFPWEGGAKKLDGALLAKAIKTNLTERVVELEAAGKTAGLGTILVGDDPASALYVRGKHRDCAEVGIKSIQIQLPSDATESQVKKAIEQLNRDPNCDGFILQLPLPKHLDADALLEMIDPNKDADGLHPVNLGKLLAGSPAVLPCTPRGITHLLEANGITLLGKDVCIVGRGLTVGKPLAAMLSLPKYGATVTLCHSQTKNLADHTTRADVVVCAIGKAHFLTADMIAPGAVVVDVGISRQDGVLAGDVAPEVALKAGYLTPNPGGVGPMTRAELLVNVVEAAERR